MKLAILAGAAALGLSGCSTTLSGFFGTGDPCQQAAAFHAGFTTVAAIEPKVAKFAKVERAAYAAVREQCADSDITNATLTKTLNAYAAALAEWKAGEPAQAAVLAKILKDAE